MKKTIVFAVVMTSMILISRMLLAMVFKAIIAENFVQSGVDQIKNEEVYDLDSVTYWEDIEDEEDFYYWEDVQTAKFVDK